MGRVIAAPTFARENSMNRILAALVAVGALVCVPLVPVFAPAWGAPKRAVVVSSGAIRPLPAGDTVLTNAATTANASINLPHGVPPTSPVDGDCWTTTTSAFCRINGVTVDLGAGGGGGGSGTVTSVALSGGTTGLTVGGTPVSGAGTLTLGGTLGLASGGTGATTAAAARTALGLGSLATQSGTFSGSFSGSASVTNTGDQDLSAYATSAAVAASLSSYATSSAVAAGYQPLAAVLTGTTSSFTAAQETKLAGVATGATANSADATLLARANHTGTQVAATISDFAAEVDARLGALATTAAVAAGYQTLDGDLTSIAALTTTTAGRALLDDADASAQRTTLGLGTLATQSGTFSGTSSGTNTGDQTSIAGITGTLAQFDAAVADANLLSVAAAAAAYQPLDAQLTDVAGLAYAGNALKTIRINAGETGWELASSVGGGTWGTITGVISTQTDLQSALDAKLDDSQATAFGLSQINDADAATGRTTLGLGTLATQSGTFSGTSSGTNTGDQTSVTGNAGTASALATGRTISLTGKATAAGGSFDGSAALAITVTALTVDGAITPTTVAATGAVTAPSVAATGAITTSSASAGFGYATGAGGTVTQATSKATAVTLNTVTGKITLNAAALAAATIVTFVFNNSTLAAEDLIVATHHATGTFGAYLINCRVTGAGAASCAVRNNSAASLSEAIVIKFAAIEAVAA